MTQKFSNRIVGSGVVNPAELYANPWNWRTHPKHQENAMSDILAKLGWIQEVIVNKTTGHLIDGHLRVETAVEQGESEIPVKYVELSESEEKLALATFDPISTLAGKDDEVLEELLAGIKTGTDIDIDTLFADVELSESEEKLALATLSETHTEEELEEVPEVPAVSLTGKGDIWKLGEHVLMCGDATNPHDVARLMEGVRTADIAFFSPPYNAGTTPTEMKANKASKYVCDTDNMGDATYFELLKKATENALLVSKYVFVNVQSLANNKRVLIDYMYKFRDVFADTIVWDKMQSQPAMHENVLNSEFEYIHIFSQNASRAVGTVRFRGTLSNILHIRRKNQNKFSDIHNATFPFELATHIVSSFSKRIVLDLFGGTGTTLIACEEAGQQCRMMEISPQYCDVIVKRWEGLTGKKAQLIIAGSIEL